MSLRELPAELAKKAKDELFEEPARIPQDLQALKDWIGKQPHLNARTDDQWLIAFLRGCKYSLERSKEKLDMYYTMRTAAPELCMAVDPLDPVIQDILSLGVVVPMTKTLKPGDPRVLLMRPGVCDPSKIKMMDVMRVNQMIASIQLLEDDNSVISGQLYIADLSNATIGHLTQMTPSLIKKAVMSGQDALPIRQKGAHHIHTPPAMETIFGFVKRFMNEKNRNRLYVHNEDMDALYKFIPKAVLPAEYGGEAGPIQDMIDYWKKKVESYRNWYLDDMKYKSDENKRPGKPKTVETLFGIEGSFRQLSVD